LCQGIKKDIGILEKNYKNCLFLDYSLSFMPFGQKSFGQLTFGHLLILQKRLYYASKFSTNFNLCPRRKRRWIVEKIIITKNNFRFFVRLNNVHTLFGQKPFGQLTFSHLLIDASKFCTNFSLCHRRKWQ
jgi:hypothetical protein